ncbi:hypothetical protein Ddye_027758 [Dipteronia dyeriana]|uniref:Uncharacterized protein n=1 Tax=Dipteronia dyeriana TaxID=168575 RepID=A0AAD9WRR2_9ROSI|nr:hypothetical protein Ddye_027758 [Dipteronia dyeriana]
MDTNGQETQKETTVVVVVGGLGALRHLFFLFVLDWVVRGSLTLLPHVIRHNFRISIANCNSMIMHYIPDDVGAKSITKYFKRFYEKEIPNCWQLYRKTENVKPLIVGPSFLKMSQAVILQLLKQKKLSVILKENNFYNRLREVGTLDQDNPHDKDDDVIKATSFEHIGDFIFPRLADFGAAISGGNKVQCQAVLEELDERLKPIDNLKSEMAQKGLKTLSTEIPESPNEISDESVGLLKAVLDLAQCSDTERVVMRILRSPRLEN